MPQFTAQQSPKKVFNKSMEIRVKDSIKSSRRVHNCSACIAKAARESSSPYKKTHQSSQGRLSQSKRSVGASKKFSARKSPLSSKRCESRAGRSPRSLRGREDASMVASPSAPQNCDLHFNRSALLEAKRSSKKIGPKSFISFSTQKTSPVRIGNRKVE